MARLQLRIADARSRRTPRSLACQRLSQRYVEFLESRQLLAVTAIFSPSSGVLSVLGTNQENTLEIGRDAAGVLAVNGGAVNIVGGPATVANTRLVQVYGLGGNDTISLNESNGALPRANLFGGPGNDTLTGGSAADFLFGQAGNDLLLGRGGIDLLFGGADNDTLAGGDADDQVFGESGNDRLVWNPGDDTDLLEGGAGIDVVEVNGGNGSEQFTATANGLRVRLDRLNPAPFALDIGTSEELVVNLQGGEDAFSATGNLAPLLKITVDGGFGNDTILGSNGDDLLLGGEGDDFIDGQQGSDTAFLGAGNDTFQWDPGDGSDVVEGQADLDTMIFNGSAGAENMDVSPTGSRLRFFRNLGNIVIDLDDVERINVNALGGVDAMTVNDLTGTDAQEINLNLAGTLGGATGDAQADTVVVNGTTGNDIVDILGAGGAVSVVGLSARVNLANTEGALDALVVNGLQGQDAVTATTLAAGIVKLTIDGGADSDTILGSQGVDVLLGGAGDDFVFGDNGNDVALLGANNDTFQWDPGDGSDTIEGQDGNDTMLFFGANGSENIDVAANGGRVRFFRDVGNITMDIDGVEKVDFRALGGADNMVVGDLSGTDLVLVEFDLRGPSSSGDGSVDNVTVNGTSGSDTFGASGGAAGIAVIGLAARVNLLNAEANQDRLTLNGLGGADVINATALENPSLQLLTMNGGLGDDLLFGGPGNDLFNGGDGSDTALMGGGDDTFVWNPGDDNDVLEGQDGRDTMLFNGANVAENIDIAANGGRVRFLRNIAAVTMDLNDVEQIEFNALGGADTIVVNDLSGTDVTRLQFDLAAAGGVGDGQADNVILAGTNGDDVILLVGDPSGTSVFGLAAQVDLLGTEAANDRVTINALAGDDVIEASGLAAGAIAFTGNGGENDDILVGGNGNDTLRGEGGDDVLLGGLGSDILDGGPGDDVEIQ